MPRPPLLVEGLFEVLVGLLCRLIGDRIRKGLFRAYIEEQDELPVARGRVLPRETLVRTLRGSVGLVCAYEELTEDVDDNQLLLWALDRARRAQLGRADVRTVVREHHRTLAASLTLVPLPATACSGRFYHHLNADYRPIHALCRVVLDACGAAPGPEAIDTIPFTVDMPRLFERFVARWLASEQTAWEVCAPHVIKLGDGFDYPVDVVLRDRASGRVAAVLDTKYKDDDRPAPADIQQVVFYATTLGCHDAFLLYPRPVRTRVVQAGSVRVRTLGIDLAAPASWPGFCDALVAALDR